MGARLNHPHVVAVFNFVVDVDTDARWLVMEYVDGTTMAQLVREEGKLSPDDAAPLLWQAADALVAAHSAGIVHRDVKPSNILVDRSRRVKLTDFGIARIAADPSLTQTGGSPGRRPTLRRRSRPETEATKPSTCGRWAPPCFTPCLAGLRTRSVTTCSPRSTA